MLSLILAPHIILFMHDHNISTFSTPSVKLKLFDRSLNIILKLIEFRIVEWEGMAMKTVKKE